ncbi:CaiB/BaiF CoA-transferase family protein [Kordiimonas sp. SCSIO 12610]|uniref:CaiB/BaiF CoA transferase family protein n=1 Tax=Kordiimonas sp. SCSIO 12610 TaxID=2829597 RepID=UPI0021094B73|nr:CaiB/BaiF CoA-transferase family protein [Kordiimonas sp. SCSIO 12610]UTW55073.1 CoA transferase [Kordiimonas sp. SCSIO 12610]
MGPLKGVKIIEVVGIGPGPFAGMMLADMGADVIAVDRPGNIGPTELKVDINRRGKKSIQLDLKSETGQKIFLDLCKNADALFEGYRPGVMERLNLGPDDISAVNQRLVYGRMTGWGQTGPLANTAGHDINYISLSGALHSIGPKDSPPEAPLNLVGDYGGGGMMLAFGLVCAILEAKNSGKGQVVDVSMVEGSSALMSIFYSLMASGQWAPMRGVNLLDGGAHFYGTFETADNKFVSLGAIEPQFMQIFIEKAGLDARWMQNHFNPAEWPKLKQELTEIFKSKTQQEWQDLLDGTDACFAPVLPFWEAHKHPHNLARNSFIEIDGVTQPAPAPKFSDTAPKTPSAPVKRGHDTNNIMQTLGYSNSDIEQFRNQGIIG